MMHIEFDVRDQFSKQLEDFGKRAPTIALRIYRTIGMSFRNFVKKTYLSGQVLGRRTGTLYKGIKIVADRNSRDAVTVRPYARLANIYHKPGGVDIVPKNGKFLKFETKDGRTIFTKHVHLKERPWVPRSVSEFQWSAEIQKAGDKVISREIAKLEAKRATG